ncbi:MAG: hypothetical protein JRN18_02795 [Nitrososphaerota archaeon]|nr:hypothetical protein [Nitrososphaerota archaeon]
MAEFLTGSTAVLEMAHDPLVLLSLIGLYGGGALTIRETALRWGKGWAGMLFLGGAYAVGEEGFGTKTMIDPLHSNIGNQLYSHFMGVNWVPLSYLTLFHAAFSIAVPLIVIDAMFPETKGRPLVGNVGVLLALASYFLVVASISLRVPYQPSLQVYVFLGLYALMWITFARKVGPRFLKPRHEAPDRREIAFVALGVWFMSAFLLIGIVGPKLFPWPVTAALYIPLAASVAWFLKEHVGLKDNDIHKVDFVIGVVAVFVPFDIGLELAKDPGVLAYTAVVLALLVAVRGRLKRRAMGVEEFALVKGSGRFESADVSARGWSVARACASNFLAYACSLWLKCGSEGAIPPGACSRTSAWRRPLDGMGPTMGGQSCF